MQDKEKIVEILVDDLDHCYCDNCKYGDYETYGDEFCDGCYRKYQNWALSSATAEEIADKIIKLGEIYPVSKEELEGAMEKCKTI